jgi:hypothetical protein
VEEDFIQHVAGAAELGSCSVRYDVLENVALSPSIISRKKDEDVKFNTLHFWPSEVPHENEAVICTPSPQ